MNCKAIQRYLLSVEDPVRLPSDLHEHVEACPECSAWRWRLLHIERHIPGLPVPPSTALARVQRRLLRVPATQLAPRTAGASPWRWRWTAIGLAASILLIVWGLWAWLGPNGSARAPIAQKKPPADLLLASLFQRHLDLARAADARQRLEALAAMAHDLSAESHPLVAAADAEGLEKLGDCYGRVVREGIVERARTLPAGQTPAFLKGIADRLDRSATDADRLARALPPAALDPMRASVESMAEAARDGGRQLRALAGDKAAALPPGRNFKTRLDEPPGLSRRDQPAGSRRGGVLLSSAQLSPVVAAPDTRPVLLNPVEQARQFQQNCGLILALVNSSIRLAAEADPLARADVLIQRNGVTERLAQEIQQAAVNRDGARAAELGQHYRSVLRGGVAANLTSASRIVQPGSTGEQDMRRIGARAVAVCEPVQQQLQLAAEDLATRDDMQRAWQAVRDGRSEVERALSTRHGPIDRRPDKIRRS
jgi:hypothetical protein